MDLAQQVRGVDSLLDLAGGQLCLGLAGRRERSLRVEALLRALKTQKALVVLDDWHALPAAEQARCADTAPSRREPAVLAQRRISVLAAAQGLRRRRDGGGAWTVGTRRWRGARYAIVGAGI